VPAPVAVYLSNRSVTRYASHISEIENRSLRFVSSKYLALLHYLFPTPPLLLSLDMSDNEDQKPTEDQKPGGEPITIRVRDQVSKYML
jgi:hypothetical protein